MQNTKINLKSAVGSLKKAIPANFNAKTALILGSGLDDAISQFEILQSIPYQEIGGFPHSTAPGHAGCLNLAMVGDTPVLIYKGRFHLYEGWSAAESAAQIRLSRLLGIEQVIITNAVGALNAEYKPSDLMLVTDHLNFTGHSPLRGENDDALGLRFPDMSEAYNKQLANLAESACAKNNVAIHKGIYAGVLGPELETSAERRFLRMAGADVVGMSLVMETIAAVHCGLKVLALTGVTNSATGGADQQPDSIEEVFENAKLCAQKMALPLPEIIQQINTQLSN